MIVYVVVILVFLPCIVFALDLVNCQGTKENYIFDPTQNQCDAVHFLGCTISCMMLVIMLIIIIKAGNV